ncbi:MAG: alpha/beta hydrolase, partial [Clostridia bacterium]|nr:alpha/beta hydrolase [Clostridia bacterium]
LLHGYLSNEQSFYHQLTYLSSSGFRVVAPDIIGFGNSSPIDKAYTVADYAKWLTAFTTAKGLIRPHIIAHSFGARIAFKALSADNSLCNKLVITGGAGIVKKRSLGYMCRVKSYRAVKKLFPNFAEKHFGSKEYKTLSPVMKQSYKYVVNEDLLSCARQIKNNTLLIYGEKDKTTPINEEGAAFLQALTNAKLVKISGGHFCFCQYPQLFNQILITLLKE